MLAGTISAAPTPWTTRKATSSGIHGASPQRADATPKAATPMISTRRRP